MSSEAVEGLLLLDKPSGPTSHAMVASTRRLLGTAKAGHTGTLDPLASGLLVLLLGRATRFASFVPDDPKVYEGCFTLGVSTDSMDMEGELIEERGYDGGPRAVGEALESLVGVSDQVPPMYSAVKYQGMPLYTYARKGEEVPRASRRISIYRAEMTAYREVGTRAEADFLIACSPGTYVRELAARVGEMLGCGGAISRLRRTASGPFRVEDAVTPHELQECIERGESRLLPLAQALRGRKRIEVTEEGLKAVRNGSPVGEEILRCADAGIAEDDVVAVVTGGEILGVHRVLSVSPFSSRALRML